MNQRPLHILVVYLIQFSKISSSFLTTFIIISHQHIFVKSFLKLILFLKLINLNHLMHLLLYNNWNRLSTLFWNFINIFFCWVIEGIPQSATFIIIPSTWLVVNTFFEINYFIPFRNRQIVRCYRFSKLLWNHRNTFNLKCVYLINHEKEVFLQGQETPIENLTYSNY